MNELGAAGQHAVGDQPQIPAEIPQALGPLFLPEGVAARSHIFGLAGEKLAGGLFDNLFLVVGENAHHGQATAAPPEKIHHRAQLAARGVAELIIGLEDQIANDAHGAGTGPMHLIERVPLCRGRAAQGVTPLCREARKGPWIRFCGGAQWIHR